MSIESWKKEFYNKKNDNRILTKWIGCRKENLKRHFVIGLGSNLHDRILGSSARAFKLGNTNCLWCKQMRTVTMTKNRKYQYFLMYNCYYCPAIMNGMSICAVTSNSPWGTWIKENDPEPMIEWVKQAIKKIRQKNRNRPTVYQKIKIVLKYSKISIINKLNKIFLFPIINLVERLQNRRN